VHSVLTRGIDRWSPMVIFSIPNWEINNPRTVNENWGLRRGFRSNCCKLLIESMIFLSITARFCFN
jgi:hypothetical protein